jgi:hypothetical protein
MTKPKSVLFACGSRIAALILMFLTGTIGVLAADSDYVRWGSDYVRWDIINTTVPFSATPPLTTITAGGVSYAQADASLSIKLTGSGIFVAPASGGESGAVTGGGTWETFNGATSTGSGTYHVTHLVSWQFANFQSPITIDLIGPHAANGNAILRIRYSDGSGGVLGVGCHGPGAPAGIQEAVIATKGYFTYWTAPAPLPTANANRTIFHILR